MNSRTWKIVAKILGLLVFVSFAVWLSSKIENSAETQLLVSQFGYIGIFVLAIASGFNIIVPIPLIAFLPIFTEAGLNFWWIITTVTIGMTIGDGVGYIVGSIGHRALEPGVNSQKILVRIQEFQKKNKTWPYLLLFFYAMIAPAPNEVIVIPMAFLGYRLRYVLPIVFVGNFIFNTISAFGVVSIIKFF